MVVGQVEGVLYRWGEGTHWPIGSHEFECTIRFSFGEGDKSGGGATNIDLHRGKISMFRSFLFGQGFWVATRVANALTEVLADG